MANPARELQLFEDIAALMDGLDPLILPHLQRVMAAANRREPELDTAWRRYKALRLRN